MKGRNSLAGMIALLLLVVGLSPAAAADGILPSDIGRDPFFAEPFGDIGTFETDADAAMKVGVPLEARDLVPPSPSARESPRMLVKTRSTSSASFDEGVSADDLAIMIVAALVLISATLLVAFRDRTQTRQSAGRPAADRNIVSPR